MRLALPCLMVACLLAPVACSRAAHAVPEASARVELDLSEAGRKQAIDGFGTMAPDNLGGLEWLGNLYFKELGASMLRVDITPRFQAPYSNFAYYSPWFHRQPALPGPGGNNVRTYSGPDGYKAPFAGHRAPIAIMGPDIEQNIRYFDYMTPKVRSAGTLAQRGEHARPALGDFKLIGSLWSPAPWLKVSSGNKFNGGGGVMPASGTPWPFIWNGNFAGGKLDTSGTELAIFDDRALGGQGKTSALTQFARGFAAYLLGFQRTFKVRFYAVSVQNELNFETFYDSTNYRTAGEYIAALKAVRAELNRHAELREIRIMGPEDLLGSDAYALWQFGGGDRAVEKNLQLLARVAEDPEAAAALAIVCVHGYAPDGVGSAGDDPTLWRLFRDGWEKSPAAGLPDRVRGFAAYQKHSWMTETSDEPPTFLPQPGAPLGNSALGLAVKISQALRVGGQSAFVYWQLLDANPVSPLTLTDVTIRERSAKFAAARHFFAPVRPGAQLIDARVSRAPALEVSAFIHEANHQLIVVLIHSGEASLTVDLGGLPVTAKKATRFTSSSQRLWAKSELKAATGHRQLELPAGSITTVVYELERAAPRPAL